MPNNSYPGWHVITVDGRLVGGFLDRDTARAVALAAPSMFYGIREHGR